jgi:hypothetical protein
MRSLIRIYLVRQMQPLRPGKPVPGGPLRPTKAPDAGRPSLPNSRPPSAPLRPGTPAPGQPLRPGRPDPTRRGLQRL